MIAHRVSIAWKASVLSLLSRGIVVRTRAVRVVRRATLRRVQRESVRCYAFHRVIVPKATTVPTASAFAALRRCIAVITSKAVHPGRRAKAKQAPLRSARNNRVRVGVLATVFKARLVQAGNAKPAHNRLFVVTKKVAPKGKAAKTRRCNRAFALHLATRFAIVPKERLVSMAFAIKIPGLEGRIVVQTQVVRWINSATKPTGRSGSVQRVVANLRVIARKAKIAATVSV